MSEIHWMSARDLLAAYRKKELSPVDVVKALLDRIEKVNPRLNAFITLMPEEALAAARDAEDKIAKGEDLEPLHGIPLAVKDNVFTAGIRTTFGSKFYENHIPLILPGNLRLPYPAALLLRGYQWGCRL